MKELLDNLKTNFLEKLPPRISETLKESIEQSERNEFAPSLQSLSESILVLIRDEYYKPSGLVWNEGMGAVEMIRELRKAGKDLGKSETDSILRIQEKAKLDDTDSVVLESCFQGAVEVLESYLREKGNRVQKKVEATERKSPGAYILEELEELLLESDTEEKIRAHFPKIEEIYRDFPYDKNVRKIYFQFLSLVDSERAKREILGYLEGGEVTIHLGAVCISLLAEMGFLYDAKKKLGWYEEEYAGEMDGKVAKLSVFLHAYLKEGREADRQRAESVLEIVGQNRDPYYSYMDNCFYIFSERETAIRQNSEGLYLFLENQFRVKAVQSKEKKKVEGESKEQEKQETAKMSEGMNETVLPEVERSSTVIHEKQETSGVESQNEIPKEGEKDESRKAFADSRKLTIYGMAIGLFFLIGAYFIFKGKTLEKTFTNSIGIEFALIASGSFLMGCSDGDDNCLDSEEPQHKVTISNSFYMGKYEVTQGQWKRVMGNNPSYFQNCGEDCPVEQVSWDDVQEFIFKLCVMEKLSPCKYRLPTEAEWEYAARAGTTTELYNGKLESKGYFESENLDRIGWFAGNAKVTYDGGFYIRAVAQNNGWEFYSEAPHLFVGTQVVGKKEPNAWGLYDMIGNVWEWNEDWYDSGYYERGEAVDPRGPSSGSNRVSRGGSWYNSDRLCRTSLRDYYTPDVRYDNLGFRLARTP